jgi:hypothetical protein
MDRVACPNCGRGYKIYNRKKREPRKKEGVKNDGKCKLSVE